MIHFQCVSPVLTHRTVPHDSNHRLDSSKENVRIWLQKYYTTLNCCVITSRLLLLVYIGSTRDIQK